MMAVVGLIDRVSKSEARQNTLSICRDLSGRNQAIVSMHRIATASEKACAASVCWNCDGTKVVRMVRNVATYAVP